MFNNRPHLWPSVSLWEEGEVGINLLEPLLWAGTSTVLSVLLVANHLLSVTGDCYFCYLQRRTGTVQERK